MINSPKLPVLKKVADGGLTICIRKDSPGKDKEANWPPAPAFSPTGRLLCAKEFFSGDFRSATDKTLLPGPVHKKQRLVD